MTKFFTLMMISMLSFKLQAQTKEKPQSDVKQEMAKTVQDLPDYAELQKRLNLKDVVTVADEEPEFPGGRKSYLQKVSENMAIIDVKNKKEFKTTVYVIVEKDGYVRNFTAISTDKKHAEAAENAVKKVFLRWKPAKVNGEAVRYIFYIPFSLRKW